VAEGGMKVGDFIVAKSSFGFGVGQITKITEKLCWVKEPNWNRPARYSQERILFSGTEDEAKALHERLVSSRALYAQEQRAVSQRHIERDDKLIADAIAAKVTA